MRIVHDDLGREIVIKDKIKRIVSLVPSLSEFIADVIGEEVLVGVTDYCIYPQSLKQNCTLIGGTKKVNLNTVTQLKPDLVIASKEENLKRDIRRLEQHDIPVYVTDIQTVKQSTKSLQSLLYIISSKELINKLLDIITSSFGLISIVPKKVVYLIWNQPIMSVGGDTYINSVIETIGCQNVFATQKRYPTITIEDLKTIQFDELWLSSEPYNFTKSEVDFFQRQLPHVSVKNVNGETFSWYGTRITHDQTVYLD